MIVAGIDGTKAGWVAVVLEAGSVRALADRSLVGLFERLSLANAIGIDMPMGLPATAVRGGRRCEQLARSLMKGRASSVFNSPCRAALAFDDYLAATAVNRQSAPDQIGLSKQSFALFPKLREVDALASPDVQERLFEVHPELSFTLLARQLGDGHLIPPKKTFSGARHRLDLLRRGGLSGVDELLVDVRSLRAAEDDVIDAAAAAWTAMRKIEGLAQRFPDQPDRDPRGLWMEIWA